jgi:DNA-binding NarL/FixJ family response regulator
VIDVRGHVAVADTGASGAGSAAPGDRIGVFLVDDHELLRRGLRDLLADDRGVEVVGEAGTAAQALARIPAVRPDVVLLDVRLPDGSGVEVCRRVCSAAPQIAVLMLTAYDEGDEARTSAARAGARGFLLKQITGEQLIPLVHRAAAGESLLDLTVTGDLVTRGVAPAPDPLDVLTGQERRVLGLIVDGLTNRQIGERLGIGENTVKNYVTSVLVKLGFERRTQVAVFGAELRGPRGRLGAELLFPTSRERSR